MDNRNGSPFGVFYWLHSTPLSAPPSLEGTSDWKIGFVNLGCHTSLMWRRRLSSQCGVVQGRKSQGGECDGVVMSFVFFSLHLRRDLSGNSLHFNIKWGRFKPSSLADSSLCYGNACCSLAKSVKNTLECWRILKAKKRLKIPLALMLGCDFLRNLLKRVICENGPHQYK